MIAMSTDNFHINDSFIPNFEQENTKCYDLTGKIDQKKSSVRSVLL